MEKKVIIARYNEDVSWVQHLNCKYVIYNKGNDVKESEIQLPNLGREAQTYLRFIIENYYRINNATVYSFLQGSPFEHGVQIEQINSEEFVDFKPHGVFVFKEGVRGPINDNFPSGLPIMPMCELLFRRDPFPSGEINFTLGAQFSASGKAIKSRCLEFYKLVHDMILKRNPIEGHVLERIWHVILDTQIEDRFTNYHINRRACLPGANWQGDIE